jgi:two-component system, OmpR family, manganese sensing response regulator
MRILLVDDEIEMVDPLSRILQKEGYGVDVAHSGAAGETLALSHPYDLLILDWMMPGRSGIEICQTLRQKGDPVPVLLLTAKDTLDDRVQGLDAGADDYLIKPFELRELLARVRALLRRPSAPPVAKPALDRLQVADLILDIPNQVAHRGDRTIDLSEKESQLLAYLMSQPQQLLTHEQIYQQVWAESETPTSNTLAAQIRLLRRKIELGNEPPLIQTVYGKGYRFGLLE